MIETIIASIISGVFGVIAGFVSGYTYCIKNKTKKTQKQFAGKNSTQVQIGKINTK